MFRLLGLTDRDIDQLFTVFSKIDADGSGLNSLIISISVYILITLYLQGLLRLWNYFLSFKWKLLLLRMEYFVFLMKVWIIP